jgi:hypothetical protein
MRVPRPTASNSEAPEMLYPTRPIDQCHTRSNNPFAIFEEDEEPDKPSTTNNTTTPGQLPIQATVPPYDPCVQEMLNQPQQATRAIRDLRPQCRAAPTATPTIRPGPRIFPRSKPTQTFTPTILPTSNPTRNTTLPAGPAYIEPNYDRRDDHCNPRPGFPPIPRDAIQFPSPCGPANIAIQALCCWGRVRVLARVRTDDGLYEFIHVNSYDV